ncbi:MAG: DMT family transporter, partial [Paracoccaceae bacterium]|nr:DMT family transporter [Paracoccaceae bacterium]
GISRHLAEQYNVYMTVMIRYWFFAVFVIALTSRKKGGIRKAAATTQPFLQIARGLILIVEICVMIAAFTILGLVESHAIFTIYPLIVVALSGPILGEKVGWRRWSAVAVGIAGMIIILRPGNGVFSIAAIIPLISAALFAIYSLLTRYVSRKDSTETSFFWTGIVGAIAISVVGVWFWEPMTPADWGWMLMLCIMATAGHWTLIKCYELAEASALQPFAYFQLVFASLVGIMLFGESLKLNVVVGASIIVLAGLFTLLRERRQR